MAAPRYPGNSIRTGRRGLPIVECVLALSVIVGLVFVTVRVMNGGLQAPLTQTAATETAVANTETPPPAQDPSDTKTP
jgi:hypothetical protein